MKQTIFMGIAALFLLGACGNHATSTPDEHTHGHEAHEHAHDHAHNHAHENEDARNQTHDHDEASDGDEILLPPEKAQAVGVQTETIQPDTFRCVIHTSGQVLTAQGDESTVVATAPGVVSFAGQLTEGTAVGRGATLLLLSSKKLDGGDQLQRARLAYETTQKEYERMQALVPDQIVSRKEFAQAKQAYENARLAYEAIAGNSSDKGVAVASPLNGYIKNVLVKEGDYVATGTPLVSVTQNRRLFLRADVSEKYYAQLPLIGSANFRTPYTNKVYELQQLGGRLLSYGKSSGENGYYLPVTFEFDNRGEVVPGAFVEVYLLSTPMSGVISLPRTALTEEQGSFFVYIQVDEEGYRKQLVVPGADNGRRVQILSGVKAGDRVVTRGAYQVRLAASSAAIPAHTHEH
ncbi:MAG: efflux RND transporter periplasmic adaptor subunit [Prevotellaceae bacterium]|jgi:RND family efflux transporter MFP subunit|nr:efflux RND transporter periplasmic adaptor subunit [Prevotellaceae bacterium]